MKRYKLGLILGGIAALAYVGLSLGLLRFIRYAATVLIGSPHLVRESRHVDDLIYRTLDGKPLRVSALRGKVVFVNLWGTWCPPCMAEMPSVEKLIAQYRNDPQMVFILATVNDKPERVRAFAEKQTPPFPVFMTQAGDVPQSLRPGVVPTTLIYARNGTVAAEHAGRADWSRASVVEFLNGLERESDGSPGTPILRPDSGGNDVALIFPGTDHRRANFVGR